jgi:hypothetical protein
LARVNLISSNMRAARAALVAQSNGATLALARGDVNEEARIKRSGEITARKAAAVQLGLLESRRTALAMILDAERVGKVDWLAKECDKPTPLLTRHHLTAARIMREHIFGGGGSSSEWKERVDGGSIHNGQMESEADRRRPVRYAIDKAWEAVDDPKARFAAFRVIFNYRSIDAACLEVEIPQNGRGRRLVRAALFDALDAAAAHMVLA